MEAVHFVVNQPSIISVVIVLYNKSIRGICSLNSVLSSSYVGEVIVCDNSTVPNDNARAAERLGITYISMEGNKGLPFAYRKGVNSSSGEVICIFDDDTSVPSDYFDAVAAAFGVSESLGICLPPVVTRDLILSPCRFNGIRGIPFEKLSDIKECDDLSGINSGLAIRRSVFDVVDYDTNLFVDYVDHAFLRDAREAGIEISYLDCSALSQQFSFEISANDQVLKRMRLFISDSKTYYSDAPFVRAIAPLAVLCHGAVLCRKRLRIRWKRTINRFLTLQVS